MGSCVLEKNPSTRETLKKSATAVIVLDFGVIVFKMCPAVRLDIAQGDYRNSVRLMSDLIKMSTQRKEKGEDDLLGQLLLAVQFNAQAVGKAAEGVDKVTASDIEQGREALQQCNDISE